MNEKASRKKGKRPPSKSEEVAKGKAKEAAEAKAEELRTALQSKGEQGQSSLGSTPVAEEKSS